MKRLKLQNLILVEKSEIVFGPSLNILTGETGSGKSAILTAIRLISGERADSSCVRTGADFAIVEMELEDSTLLRREIYRSGKNRCFINDAQVNLIDLKKLCNLEVVGQNSASEFFESAPQTLDLFANLEHLSLDYQKSKTEEKELSRELEDLKKMPKDRELEWARKDLELLEEINWTETIEETLIKEHELLAHQEQIIQKMTAAAYPLTEGPELIHLKKAQNLIEQSAKIDSKLNEASARMKSAVLEMEEVGREIQSYVDSFEMDPQRLAIVEKELGIIASLKRRLGPDLSAVKSHLTSQIEKLESLDETIASIENSLIRAREETHIKLQLLLKKRKEFAPKLSKLVLNELEELNIPYAQFEIRVTDEFSGVEFFFSANPGVKLAPAQLCASGGEISRLFLAIKIVLANGHSSLIFDEIDSNVGGQSASALGKKLHQLSASRQIICVTHFVQVAKYASDHFLVSKETEDLFAYTRIRKLSEKEKEVEYNRMLGRI